MLMVLSDQIQSMALALQISLARAHFIEEKFNNTDSLLDEICLIKDSLYTQLKLT